MGITLDIKEGKKKKGPMVVYKIALKHRKRNFAKKAKAPFKRNLNTFTTELPVKKGVTPAANVALRRHFVGYQEDGYLPS